MGPLSQTHVSANYVINLTFITLRGVYSPTPYTYKHYHNLAMRELYVIPVQFCCHWMLISLWMFGGVFPLQSFWLCLTQFFVASTLAGNLALDRFTALLMLIVIVNVVRQRLRCKLYCLIEIYRCCAIIPFITCHHDVSVDFNSDDLNFICKYSFIIHSYHLSVFFYLHFRLLFETIFYFCPFL